MEPTQPPMPPRASRQRLLRSTAIALAVAAVLLTTVVLPAEYGIDPTGVGRVIGLTEMGEIKMQLARELEEAEAAALTPAPAPTSTGDLPAMDSLPQARELQVTLAPNQGKELKLVMAQGTTVAYRWATDRGGVNYDTHGDNTSAGRSYFGYGKGTGVASDEGTLTAQFDGNHGWFWRNRTSDTVTITLTVQGAYREVVLPR